MSYVYWERKESRQFPDKCPQQLFMLLQHLLRYSRMDKNFPGGMGEILNHIVLKKFYSVICMNVEVYFSR